MPSPLFRKIGAHLFRIQSGQQCQQRHWLGTVRRRFSKFKCVPRQGPEGSIAGAVDEDPPTPCFATGIRFRNQVGDRPFRRTLHPDDTGIAADLHAGGQGEFIQQHFHRLHLESRSPGSGELQFVTLPQRLDNTRQDAFPRFAFRIENPCESPGGPYSTETTGLLDQHGDGTRFCSGNRSAHTGRSAAGDNHLRGSGFRNFLGFKFYAVHDRSFAVYYTGKNFFDNSSNGCIFILNG